jgi:hypothetical protein
MNRRWNFITIAIILFSPFQFLSLAGTYYIDPSARYNGDGTLGTPATGPGQPGAFNAWPRYPRSAGDKYYQKCGTTFTVPWQDGIYLGNKDGKEGNETIFGAYFLDSNNHEVIGVSGEKPIITGLTSLPGWDNESNWSSRGNNIWSWELGSTSPYRLWIDGSERLMAGFNPSIENANPNGISRINPNVRPAIYWCHDTYPPDGGGDVGTTLYVYSVNNPAITYSSMEGLQAIDRIFTVRDSDHVIIENLDIRAAKFCLFIDRSNHVIIQNCDIGKDAHIGIHIRGTIVRGKGLTADHGIIRGCIIDSDFHFDGYAYEDQGPNYGIEMKDGSNNWEIYHNEIKNWGHSGVNIFSISNSTPTMNSNNNNVHENYFTAPEASHCRAFNLTGSTPGRCSNNKIYLNYIYNMPTRSQITADRNKICYNIFDTMTNDPYYLHNNTWKTSGEGIEIWAGDDSKICEYNKIYNNVFYNTGEAGIRLRSWGHNQKVQHNEIVNNIFYKCGVNAKSGRESFDSGDYAGAALVVEAWRATDDDMLTNNIFRNNLIFNTKNGNDVRYKGKSMTVADFNSSGIDGDTIENNIQSPPQFMNAANGDFSLHVNSEAIGRGYDLGENYPQAIAPGVMRRNWPGSISTIRQIIPWDIGAFKCLKGSDSLPPAPPLNLRVIRVRP